MRHMEWIINPKIISNYRILDGRVSKPSPTYRYIILLSRDVPRIDKSAGSANQA